jgi:hypothetical protein
MKPKLPISEIKLRQLFDICYEWQNRPDIAIIEMRKWFNEWTKEA